MLSVIVPVMNEEKNIKIMVERLAEVLNSKKITYEVVFVDDGSKDKSVEAIKECSIKDDHIKGITFTRNFGKEAAIMAGLQASKGDCCVVIDGDLQHPITTVVEMYNLWQEGYEIIEGVKNERGKENFLYKIFANSFYKLISKYIDIDMKSSSDFKLIDRKVVDVLLSLPEKNRFFRALTFWFGYRSINVYYQVEPRLYGETKWNVSSLFKYAINNLTGFTSAPLHLVTFMGLIFLILSVLLSVQTLYNLAVGNAVEGFTTVIILILITGSCIMLSLGIIGIYISKIYNEIKNRPLYIINEYININEQL